MVQVSVRKRVVFTALMVLLTIIFGLGNVVTKHSFSSISPLWCLALRFGLAVAVLLLLFGRRVHAQLKEVAVRTWLPAAALMALTYILAIVPLNFTTATNVGFLVALPVLFVPLVASVVRRSVYPKAFIPLQAMVLVGLFMLCCNGGSLAFGPGEAMALASSVTLAAALVLSEQGLKRLDVATIATTQALATFVVALVSALVLEGPLPVQALDAPTLASVAYLGILCTCVTFFIQYKALSVLKSSTVSLLLTGEPVFTALFSFVLLGEALGTVGLVGAVFIMAAVVAGTVFEGQGAATYAPAHLLVRFRMRLSRQKKPLFEAGEAPCSAVENEVIFTTANSAAR